MQKIKDIGLSIALQEAALAVPKRPDIPHGEVRDVVHTHDQDGLNYVWLEPYFGKVLWIDYNETGQWKTYNSFWWTRHGQLISHNPDRLVEEHMAYYVTPATKRIDLRFYFKSPLGFVYMTNPTREFYELEAAYFRRHGFCNPKSPGLDVVSVNKEMAKQLKRPGLAVYVPPEHVPAYLLALSSVGRLMTRRELKQKREEKSIPRTI